MAYLDTSLLAVLNATGFVELRTGYPRISLKPHHVGICREHTHLLHRTDLSQSQNCNQLFLKPVSAISSCNLPRQLPGRMTKRRTRDVLGSMLSTAVRNPCGASTIPPALLSPRILETCLDADDHPHHISPQQSQAESSKPHAPP